MKYYSYCYGIGMKVYLSVIVPVSISSGNVLERCPVILFSAIVKLRLMFYSCITFMF